MATYCRPMDLERHLGFHLSLNSSVTDVLSESSGAISGVDTNADKILDSGTTAGKTLDCGCRY